MRSIWIFAVATSLPLSVGMATPQSPPSGDKEPKMLFKAVNQADVKLTEKQMRILERIKKTPATLTVTLLALQPKTLENLGDSLRVPLAAGKNLDIDKYTVTKADRSTILNWGGKSTLSISGEFISGLIYTNKEVFEIRPLGDGLHALATLDQSKYKDEPKDKK